MIFNLASTAHRLAESTGRETNFLPLTPADFFFLEKKSEKPEKWNEKKKNILKALAECFALDCASFRAVVISVVTWPVREFLYQSVRLGIYCCVHPWRAAL